MIILTFDELKIGDIVEVKFKNGEIYKGYVDKDEEGEKMLVLLDKIDILSIKNFKQNKE